jgi:hypothetical protein
VKIVRIVRFSFQCGFVGIKQIKDAVGYGVVEKARNPEEPLGHRKYPLHKQLELYALAE